MRPSHCVPYYPAASCRKPKPSTDLAAALAMWSTTIISRNTKNFAKEQQLFAEPTRNHSGQKRPSRNCEQTRYHCTPREKTLGFVFLFLPQLIISLPYRYHLPSSLFLTALPFLTTSHRPHLPFSPFPSSPLPFGITPLQHRFPWSTNSNSRLSSSIEVHFITSPLLFCEKMLSHISPVTRSKFYFLSLCVLYG